MEKVALRVWVKWLSYSGMAFVFVALVIQVVLIFKADAAGGNTKRTNADQRSKSGSKLRKPAANDRMNDRGERVAKLVVEKTIPGARMHYRAAQQHAGGYDFDLEYPGGQSVPLEATTSTIEKVERTRAAIQDPSKGGHFVSATLCSKSWYVHPCSGANINAIRANVDRYLADLESAGITEFFAPLDAVNAPAVMRIWKDLRVESGSVATWIGPGQKIGIALPGAGGAVSVQAAIEAILSEASKTDNLNKLGAVQTAAERHLFVHVDWNNFLANVAMRDMNPPSTIPNLPKEITHIWAATYTGSPDTYVVWRASASSPWTKTEIVTSLKCTN